MRKRLNKLQSLPYYSTDTISTRMFFLQSIAQSTSVQLGRSWNKKKLRKGRRRKRDKTNCWKPKRDERRKSSSRRIRSLSKNSRPQRETTQQGHETEEIQSQAVLPETTNLRTLWLMRVGNQKWNLQTRITKNCDVIQRPEMLPWKLFRARGLRLRI